MPRPNDLSRSLVAVDHNSTIIAVVELSQSRWLVGSVLPGAAVNRARSWGRAQSGSLTYCIAGADEAVGAGPNITRDRAVLQSRSRRLLVAGEAHRTISVDVNAKDGKVSRASGAAYAQRKRVVLTVGCVDESARIQAP